MPAADWRPSAFWPPKWASTCPCCAWTLGLTRRTSYEDAIRADERLTAEFGLGKAPTTGLDDVMEKELSIMVFMSALRWRLVVLGKLRPI